MGVILDSSTVIAGEKKGIFITSQDLIIGVTALEFGYSVATLNVRHFEMIPGMFVHRL